MDAVEPLVVRFKEQYTKIQATANSPDRLLAIREWLDKFEDLTESKDVAESEPAKKAFRRALPRESVFSVRPLR
jgi:hypothetical protein